MRAPKLQNFTTKQKLRKKYNFLSISEFNSILNECEKKHPDEVVVYWANGHQVHALSPKIIETIDDIVEKKIALAIQKSRKRYLDYIKDVFGGEIKINSSGELYVDPEEFINNL